MFKLDAAGVNAYGACPEYAKQGELLCCQHCGSTEREHAPGARKMKVIYVAGPFRGPNAWAIENNIRRAEALALKAWELGAAVICPHANTRFYQGVGPDSRWLAGDLAILRKCDGMLLTSDWELSEGARLELDFALRERIPPFFHLEELKLWLETGEYFQPALLATRTRAS